jgi:hypothetical protein
VAGADTEAVLAEQGFSAEEIRALLDAGVAGPRAALAATADEPFL